MSCYLLASEAMRGNKLYDNTSPSFPSIHNIFAFEYFYFEKAIKKKNLQTVYTMNFNYHSYLCHVQFIYLAR